MRFSKIQSAIAVTALLLLPVATLAQENRLRPNTSALALGVIPAPVEGVLEVNHGSSDAGQLAPTCHGCRENVAGGAVLTVLASGAGMIGGAMMGAHMGDAPGGDIVGALYGGLAGSVLLSTIAANRATNGESFPLLGSLIGAAAGLGTAMVAPEAMVISYPVVQGLITLAFAK